MLRCVATCKKRARHAGERGEAWQPCSPIVEESTEEESGLAILVAGLFTYLGE
jgi:hypothetical protein